jgi:hypothetical protein
MSFAISELQKLSFESQLEQVLVSSASLVVLYFFGRWLVTPKPLPGIPHYSIRPFGDLSRIEHVKNTGMQSTWFNLVAQDLGPISQISLGTSKAIVLSDIQEREDILLRRAKEFDR